MAAPEQLVTRAISADMRAAAAAAAAARAAAAEARVQPNVARLRS